MPVVAPSVVAPPVVAPLVVAPLVSVVGYFVCIESGMHSAY